MLYSGIGGGVAVDVARSGKGSVTAAGVHVGVGLYVGGAYVVGGLLSVGFGLMKGIEGRWRASPPDCIV